MDRHYKRSIHLKPFNIWKGLRVNEYPTTGTLLWWNCPNNSPVYSIVNMSTFHYVSTYRENDGPTIVWRVFGSPLLKRLRSTRNWNENGFVVLSLNSSFSLVLFDWNSLTSLLLTSNPFSTRRRPHFLRRSKNAPWWSQGRKYRGEVLSWKKKDLPYDRWLILRLHPSPYIAGSTPTLHGPRVLYSLTLTTVPLSVPFTITYFSRIFSTEHQYQDTKDKNYKNLFIILKFLLFFSYDSHGRVPYWIWVKQFNTDG